MMDQRHEEGLGLQQAVRRQEVLVHGLGLLEELEDLQPGVALDDLCVRLLGLISSLGMAQNCSLMFLAQDGIHLNLYAAASPGEASPVFLPPGAWPGKRFRRGEGAAGHVLRTGQPFFSLDVTLNSEFTLVPDGVPIRSLICLPLNRGARLLGVLNLSHAAPQAFPTELFGVMRLAASACARHLEQVLGHEENGEGLHESFFRRPKAHGIVVFDLYGRVREANPAISELTGFTLQHLMTPKLLWSSLAVESDRPRLEAQRERVRSMHAPDQIEYRFVCADGTPVSLHELTFPLFDENTRCSGFLSMISEAAENGLSEVGRMQSEAQLRQAQKIQALGELASGVAHDLNNLLTGVLGHIDLAMLCINRDEIFSLLTEAQRAGLRGAELLHKLLAFGHLSKVEKRAVDLSGLLDEVAAICSTFKRRYSVVLRRPERLHPVIGDLGQLHQVLLNLCLNARDALEAAEALDPERDLTLVLGAENVHFDERVQRPWPITQPGHYVRLYVADTGSGIDPRTQARMYEPFFTTKPPGKGTGLGLATVYRIVRQHGGYIDVETEPGRSTCFSVYLRARVGEAEARIEEQVKSLVPRGTETVLLVDDEELLRNVGGAILHRLGYKVLLAEDGLQAVQVFMAQREKIDLVILDVAMPKLTGTEALKRIRNQDPQACIMLSSGYTLEQDESQPPQYRPDALLKKPYLLHSMAQLLRTTLDARAQPRTRR